MLEVDKLTVTYGSIDAVRDMSLRVLPGEVVALIGANGAGKSSILKGILGLAKSGGSVKVDGREVGAMPTHQRVAAGIALSPEGRHVFPELSVKENLELGYRPIAGASIEKLIDEMFDLFPRLKERQSQMAGRMSGGEQQMLAIGRALMSSPRVLMLDEPTLGLAPIVVQQLEKLLVTLKARGLAVLLAEQNAEMALANSGRAYILETGTCLRTDLSASLARDPIIREAYLGL